MKTVIGVADGKVRIVNSDGFDGLYSKYTVVAGDTLGKIAAANDTTVELLAKVNEIENVDLINVDQVLLIPVKEAATKAAEPLKAVESNERVIAIGGGLFRIMDSNGFDGLYKKYTVVAGDTLGKLAAANKTTVELLAKVNKIENVDLIEVDQELYIPVEEK